MTLSQPTELPKWAAQDQIDPVSGQNNVLKPPGQQLEYGWQRLAFPPRNWFNWLGRLTYQWLAYFQQNDPRSQTVVIRGTYGVATPPICDVNRKSIISLMIVSDTTNFADDFYMSNFTPRNATPNRNIDANVLNSNNISIPAGLDFTTGSVTVTTLSAAVNFQLVATQYDLGVL